jgi:carboxyl-terminal processing protease
MKILIVALGFGALVAGTALYPEDDPRPKETIILNAILKVQEQAHFSSATIDDAFSKKVFDQYLESMDYNKRFLHQKDVDSLTAYAYLIDDHIKTGNLEFFDMSLRMINRGIERSKGWYEEILESPFDFSEKSTYETRGENRDWQKDEEDLKAFWKDMLKYETLVKLNRKLSKVEGIEKKDKEELTDNDKEWLAKSSEELEAESREDVKEMFENWFDRMEDVRRSDRFEVFVNSITHVLDPHTDYFNPKEKEDFDINMSGRLEGIGARLQTDGDYTKVVEIIPGGPAWKQKELEPGDLISAVRQEDAEEIEDLTGMRIDDVVKRIRGKKGTEVTLTVIKKDGTEELITIERDEVIIDEGFAKSLMIEHESVQPQIGYIYLPRFYSNFNSEDGPKASRDIKNQLEKLEAEGAQGIILDLRGNGGGSLHEVIDISGLFIEDGPIVQVKGRQGKPYVYRDKDPSVAYTGPLIVMVDAYSASASEILAAALQDYDRAVIIGSQQTFGKGTVQRFIDLDRAVSGLSEMKPLGQVKVTTQKYYRVDGGSVQLRGVRPDIILPDNFSYIKTGEQDYDYAMDWSRIEGIPHDQDVYRVQDLDRLRSLSSQRITGDSIFNIIDMNAKRIKEHRETTELPLDIERYSQLVKERKDASDSFEEAFKPIEEMSLKNPAADLAYIAEDSSRIARNDKWIEQLSKDVYLEEAIFIMSDLLAVKKP